MIKALIFDCDGVLVDTERDAHRVGFNRAFAEMGIDAEWDVELYGKLLLVAGGKERMTAYFNQYGWPEGIDTVEASEELIFELGLRALDDELLERLERRQHRHLERLDRKTERQRVLGVVLREHTAAPEAGGRSKGDRRA